jgi:hypothetical protein
MIAFIPDKVKSYKKVFFFQIDKDKTIKMGYNDKRESNFAKVAMDKLKSLRQFT